MDIVYECSKGRQQAIFVSRFLTPSLALGYTLVFSKVMAIMVSSGKSDSQKSASRNQGAGLRREEGQRAHGRAFTL